MPSRSAELNLACQEHLLPGETYPRKWAAARAAGFDGIEVRSDGSSFRQHLPGLRKAMREGATFPTVCPVGAGYIGDADDECRRVALERMKLLLSGMSDLGGGAVITPASFGLYSEVLPRLRHPHNHEKARTQFLDAVGELGEHAHREGVLVLLEPLNRYEDTMLNQLSDAVEICESLGLASVRVMADAFHMNIEEDDAPIALRQAAPYVRHIHLADSNRQQPGCGHTDFRALFESARDTAFDGFFALECGLRGHPTSALEHTVHHLRRLWDSPAA